MSLVGPRPPLPREVAKYTVADRRRLAAKPGITCLWQIGGRSEIDFSGQVKLDVNYIETQSFWKDINILVKTVPAVAGGKGAC
jgi:lipopolysaccharide/colanic/teichoic acid biosynthesis glycosyltransferase